MATAVYCSGLWGSEELGAGGRGVGSRGHARDAIVGSNGSKSMTIVDGSANVCVDDDSFYLLRSERHIS